MCEAALHDPALAAETGAVRCSTTRDDGSDPERPQEPAVLVEVIAAISENTIGLLAWPTALASDRPGLQVLDQWQQLGDVVTVAAGQSDRERDAARVYEQMVL